ncbi:hypothetical protein TWF106_007046 [Orbilia oligospora]|uniref:Uncharacterized protein n=1 Tax=Orbilia oligospora TaxID=2813651 RepID=A0A7C8UZG7_ORBOL|nr:hypothetical protein TWF106_007046 [Orbilia oligospora]
MSNPQRQQVEPVAVAATSFLWHGFGAPIEAGGGGGGGGDGSGDGDSDGDDYELVRLEAGVRVG